MAAGGSGTRLSSAEAEAKRKLHNAAFYCQFNSLVQIFFYSKWFLVLRS